MPQAAVPRQGHPLAEQVLLSEHCLERYRVRAGRPAEWRLRTVRKELTQLIAARGIAVERPPSWLHGGHGATVFYVTLDGMLVLPVQQRRVKDGVAPWPYVATTCLSRDLADADLAELTGEDLAALLYIPPRIATASVGGESADRQAAVKRLRKAVIAGGRAHRDPPGWLRSRRPLRDRFYVSLDDGVTLVVVRARRDEGHGGRYCVTDLVRDAAMAALTGAALLAAVRLDYVAIQAYRTAARGAGRCPWSFGVAHRGGGDARPDATGVAQLGRRVDGAVLLLGDDAALHLLPVEPSDDEPARFRAVFCSVRHEQCPS